MIWKNFTSSLDRYFYWIPREICDQNQCNKLKCIQKCNSTQFLDWQAITSTVWIITPHHVSFAQACGCPWYDDDSKQYLSASVFFYLQKHNFPINYTIRVHSYEVFKLSNISRMVNITNVILLWCICYDTNICPFQWMSQETSFSNQSLQVENLTLQRLWFQVNQGILKKVREVELTFISNVYCLSLRCQLPSIGMLHNWTSDCCFHQKLKAGNSCRV